MTRVTVSIQNSPWESRGGKENTEEKEETEQNYKKLRPVSKLCKIPDKRWPHELENKNENKNTKKNWDNWHTKYISFRCTTQ